MSNSVIMRFNRHCCVDGCPYTRLKNPELRFYEFPRKKLENEKRDMWILAVRRGNGCTELWKPRSKDYICSAHFFGGRKSNERHSVAYVPTIFPEVYKQRMESKIKFKKRQEDSADVRNKMLKNVDLANTSTGLDESAINFCHVEVRGSPFDVTVDIKSEQNGENSVDEIIDLASNEMIQFDSLDEKESLICIKTEIEIKSEELCDDRQETTTSLDSLNTDSCISYIVTEEIEVKSEECGRNSFDSLNTNSSISYIATEELEIKSESYDENSDDPLHNNEPMDSISQHRDSSHTQIQPYECDLCYYKTKYKGNLKAHQLQHKDPSEVPMFKCYVCDFKSKRKRNVQRHQLIHKSFSEGPMYKCDMCDYKSNQVGYLKRHQMVHKDISELPTYKCHQCNYETRHRFCITRHQLRHKDVFEVPIYKCEMCDFETRHKLSIDRHQLIHKGVSELQMHRCDLCNYKCKRKDTLSKHRLKHQLHDDIIDSGN